MLRCAVRPKGTLRDDSGEPRPEYNSSVLQQRAGLEVRSWQSIRRHRTCAGDLQLALRNPTVPRPGRGRDCESAYLRSSAGEEGYSSFLAIGASLSTLSA